MDEFVGSKAAIFCGEKLIVQQAFLLDADGGIV